MRTAKYLDGHSEVRRTMGAYSCGFRRTFHGEDVATVCGFTQQVAYLPLQGCLTFEKKTTVNATINVLQTIFDQGFS